MGIEHIGIYLKDIHRRKASGQLHFRQGNIQKYLYFKGGALVHARTNQPQELLGEVLFRRGKIPEDVYSRIDEFIEPRKSIGQILIDNQLISRDDLRDGLSYQMREITLNIFPNFMGKLGFQDKQTLDTETFDVRLDVPALIESGIRRMKYHSRLRDMMSSMVPYVSKREFFFHLTEEEKEIYAAINGERASAGLLDEGGFSPPLFWKSLYLFYCLDLIGLRKLVGGGPSGPSRDSGTTQAKSNSTRGGDARGTIPNAAEIAEIAAGIEAMDYFQVLDVTREATAVEVKKAYFQMARKYHPDLFERSLSQEIKSKIDLIFDRITKAYHTLNDPDQREDYQRKIKEVAGGGPREGEKQADINFRKAKTLFNQARYKEALVFLEDAIRLQNHKASYFLLLALTQSKLPNFHRKAVENYRTAIRLEPWSVDGYLGLGMLFKQEGMPIMAAKQLKKALSLDADNRIVRRELEEIEPRPRATGFKDLLSGDLGGLLKKLKKK